jgi:phosphoserine phosphatase
VLVALDFDGTLSPDEMVVLLADRAGVSDEVERVTRRAMAGEIEYAESLRRRVGLLAGLPESELQAAYTAIRLRPGVGSLIQNLQRAGARTAILTGGFEDGVTTVLRDLDVDVDRIVANRLEMSQGNLSGEVTGPLVEGSKDTVLREVASEMGVSMTDTVAVGDGANDAPMLSAAGFAVGFQPKPSVAPVCDALVDTVDELDRLLSERT